MKWGRAHFILGNNSVILLDDFSAIAVPNRKGYGLSHPNVAGCWTLLYVQVIYLRFCRFFRYFEASVKKKCYTCIIQSTFECNCSPLLSCNFWAVYESCTERTGHVLKWSSNWSSSWLLHLIGSAGQQGHGSWFKTGKKPWEKCSGDYGGRGSSSDFRVSKFVLKRGAEHCQGEKSLSQAFCRIASVGLSKLGSNALIVFDENHKGLFSSVSTTHYRIRRAAPYKRIA